MPELPEVETTRRSLEPLVVGRTIESVEVRCANLRRPLDEDFAARLAGRRLLATARRAKYLIFELDAPESLIVHLGMSGRLIHRPPPVVEPLKHDHVLVALDDDSLMVFHDPRRFGLVALVDTDDCDLLRGIGPEPFDRDLFHGAYLAALGRKTVRTIKDVLMDQRVVAGLGNIYVNEVLFACGIRPRRRLARMTRAECDGVVAQSRVILADAIEHRGSSVSDFLDGVGRRGGYQWKHQVYDREGQPCPRCATPIKAVVIAQRSSFYCPKCQR